MKPEERGRLTPADAAQAQRLHTFAHDLKNKLGGLWESLRLLAAGPEGLEPAEVLAFAERNFFQAQRQLEDLLDDLAVDRAVILRDLGPVDLVATLQLALDRVSGRLERKQQRLEVDAPGVAQVHGDQHWLMLLLEALLSNASKFSPAGSSIRASITRTGGDHVVRICDPGVGLSEEDLRSVFQRYAILGSRSTQGEPQSRGTLARALQWAQAHGGSLTAESEGPGRGACFTLRLPAGP